MKPSTTASLLRGTADACRMKSTGKASSTLICGDVPAYNYLTANLSGGALVISRITGVDDVAGSKKVTEIARRPTNATSLRATGPASPLLARNHACVPRAH